MVTNDSKCSAQHQFFVQNTAGQNIQYKCTHLQNLIIIFANWAIFKNAYFVKMCPKAGKEDLTKE